MPTNRVYNGGPMTPARAWARGFVYAYQPTPMRLHAVTQWRCAYSQEAWERLLRRAGLGA